MSQSVERLKELLFNSETVALRDLAQRIDALSLQETRSRDEIRQLVDALGRNDSAARADLTRRIDVLAETDSRQREALVQRLDAFAKDETEARAELRRKLDEVYARAGDSEALAASVAEIIDESLRRAEVKNHTELSRSIAPLVVSTIKSELRNSQDEMVEALYPITGRLVKSYVASALKDLTDQMNRRLEQNAVMLRLQSLTTGRSVGELAMAGARTFAIKELYLIRRGTGELVAHWSESSLSGREHAMSGVLAAVNEFANEAFSADQSTLRQIDLGDEEVYLRGSPVYLLAARCAGEAPQGVEQLLDDALLSAVERQHRIDSGPQTAQSEREKATALADLGTELKSAIAEQYAEAHAPRSFGLLKLLAALVLLPLFGFLAWNWYVDYRINTTRTAGQRVIASETAMLGYPIHLDVSNRGRAIAVSGLTPSQSVKQRIVEGLQKSLPGITVQDQLAVVAGSGIVLPDFTPDLERVRTDLATTVKGLALSALQRDGKRADTRLRAAAADLARASAQGKSAADADAAALLTTELIAIQNESDRLLRALDADPQRNAAQAANFHALTERLDSAAHSIMKAAGIPLASAPGVRRDSKSTAENVPPLDVTISHFAAGADHVANLAASLSVANALRPEPPAPALPPASPSARELLAQFARDHAVFFSNSVDYRDSARVTTTLTKLAELMKASGAVVRVVGYTDEVGASQRNAQLALERAAKVHGDLMALGVQSNQLVVVGRANALDLSDARGALSPNRRVEFELGFEGETAP